MTIYPQEEIMQMINDCVDDKRIHMLSDWERSFISTCGNMADKKIPLSDKQRNILNPLWERVTANG